MTITGTYRSATGTHDGASVPGSRAGIASDDLLLAAAVRNELPGATDALCRAHGAEVRALAPVVGSDVIARSWTTLVAEVRLTPTLRLPLRALWLAHVRRWATGSSAVAGPHPAWAAFRALAPGEQLLLWHHEVERDDTAALARLRGSGVADVDASLARACAELATELGTSLDAFDLRRVLAEAVLGEYAGWYLSTCEARHGGSSWV